MRTVCICCGRPRGNREEKLCCECMEKRNILRSHGRIFAGQPPEKGENTARPTGLERLYASGYRPDGIYDRKHGMRIGVHTKKLVDLVNASGTVHYGRMVHSGR